MPPTERRVWTTGRKIAGNLLPLLLASPLAYVAVREFGRSGPSARTLLWVVAFCAASWLLLALLGLVGNGSMKREVGRRLHIERPFDQTERYFVGFARPAFRSALDPHEDVGFLIFHDHTLEFWGTERKATIERGNIVGVRFRANTHSLVGLGRWVSVEAVVDERPVRLLVEPRHKATLPGNLFFGRRLRDRIREWQNQEGPAADATDPS